jgi:hypothetical protein
MYFIYLTVGCVVFILSGFTRCLIIDINPAYSPQTDAPRALYFMMGGMRSFKYVIPSLEKHLLPLPSIDIAFCRHESPDDFDISTLWRDRVVFSYVSTENKTSTKKQFNSTISYYYEKNGFDTHCPEDANNRVRDEAKLMEDMRSWRGHQHTGQLAVINQCFQALDEYERAKNFRYHFIVRSRFDLALYTPFPNVTALLQIEKEEMESATRKSGGLMMIPTNGELNVDYHGLQDRLYILNRHALQGVSAMDLHNFFFVDHREYLCDEKEVSITMGNYERTLLSITRWYEYIVVRDKLSSIVFGLLQQANQKFLRNEYADYSGCMRYRHNEKAIRRLPFNIDKYARYPDNCSVTCSKSINPHCGQHGCCR